MAGIPVYETWRTHGQVLTTVLQRLKVEAKNLCNTAVELGLPRRKTVSPASVSFDSLPKRRGLLPPPEWSSAFLRGVDHPTLPRQLYW